MTEAAGTGLVIFDCDGVLVDSEPISLSVMREVLADEGCPMTEAEGYEQLLGRSISTIARTLRQDRGLVLGECHLEVMRQRLYARFAAELRPITHVAQAIDDLGGPVCVASSSQPDRIKLSLELTGLYDKFAPNIFSASMVQNGKPAPDLFLFAAAQMGVDPANCTVIEDSPAGILAAKRAGMKVVAFVGGGHAGPANLYQQAIALEPNGVVETMSELVATLRTIR
ncbi:HAD family hydrolase [Donghicola mangrovi]|uniref:HAD family hydrolase n=1 Tax=Donghicola mangrovi TaxID=2729614 RepID=UPI0030B849D6